jgi:hypothetical protein
LRRPAGVRDIPSGNCVGRVDIRLERMNRVQLPDHLQRAGSDGGLKHAPPLLADPSTASSRGENARDPIVFLAEGFFQTGRHPRGMQLRKG